MRVAKSRGRGLGAHWIADAAMEDISWDSFQVPAATSREDDRSPLFPVLNLPGLPRNQPELEPRWLRDPAALPHLAELEMPLGSAS